MRTKTLRDGTVKNSNGNFIYKPHEEHRCYSYVWWLFARQFGEVIIFNDYDYSNSTRKHQCEGRQQLPRVDIFVSTEVSLSDPNWLGSAKAAKRQDIRNLISAIRKPKTRATTNAERRERIKALRVELNQLYKLEL